jgi:serine/threonine protein kinase
MEAFHSRNIVHRDLNPANLLVDVNLRPVISDSLFISGRPLPDPDQPLCLPGSEIPNPRAKIPNPRALPELFQAPELRRSDRYSEPADVYTFGMIMYALFSEGPLIQNLDMKFAVQPTTVEALAETIDRGDRFRYSPSIPGQYWLLIRRCWDRMPAKRPTFGAIVDILRSDWAVLKGTDARAVELYRPFLQAMSESVRAKPKDDGKAQGSQ